MFRDEQNTLCSFAETGLVKNYKEGEKLLELAGWQKPKYGHSVSTVDPEITNEELMSDDPPAPKPDKLGIIPGTTYGIILGKPLQFN